MPRKAFTLVELLVVIAIIGLLSTVAVIASTSSRKQSRNTKRLADIKQMVTAFDLGLSASSDGNYPSSGGDVWTCVSTACTGSFSSYVPNGTVDAFFTPYMSKPTDPNDSSRGFGGYVYNGAWVGGTGPSGIAFATGSYLSLMLESGATNCGSGQIYNNTLSFVQCMVKLSK